MLVMHCSKERDGRRDVDRRERERRWVGGWGQMAKRYKAYAVLGQCCCRSLHNLYCIKWTRVTSGWSPPLLTFAMKDHVRRPELLLVLEHRLW
jgi:hypothetical protein